MSQDFQEYENESFLDISIGNFADCVENLVYNYQKYIDMLYLKLPCMINDMKKVSSQESEEIFFFVISEHEKILIAKGINFSLECLNLLIRKYDNLRSELGCHRNNRYYISIEAYDTLFNSIKSLDIANLRDNMYDEKFKGIETNFVEYMHGIMKSYEDIEYQANMNNEFTPDSISMLLDNSCMRIIQILTQLKDLSETSTSINTTLNIVKYIIDILVATFELTSTMVICRIEDECKAD